jgi:hypothetical protein
MRALVLAPVLALATLSLAAPSRLEAAHRHGPGCGHRGYTQAHRGDHRAYAYPGRGHSYGYRPRVSYGYGYPAYGYRYGYRPDPGYGAYGYYGYPAYGYGYYPPPPPPRFCRPRPRIEIHLGF